MTVEKLMALVEMYRLYFWNNNIGKTDPDEDDDTAFFGIFLLMRCHRMLDEIEKLVREAQEAMQSTSVDMLVLDGRSKLKEACLALGLVQGCLISAKAYSVAEIKSHNRFQ